MKTHHDQDLLTNSMSARAFMEAMIETGEEAPEAGLRFVAMVNLDRFKAVNDLHGRPIGDLVLKEVARRIGVVVGKLSSVARLGGDTFAILIEATEKHSEIESTARKIIEVTSAEFLCEGKKLFIGSSVGLSAWPQKTLVPEVLRRADKALQLAKSSGRGCFAWYTEKIGKPAIVRAVIEADLREAVESSTIEPWFQPIISLSNFKLSGFEVLARWSHEKHGRVAPEHFIQTAEQSNIIDHLSSGLFGKACNVARNWDSNLSISYNISPHQFLDPDLFSRIQEALQESHLAPSRLTLEITESAVIHDFTNARRTLDAFKKLGIMIALDDFGTGYSSLSNLGNLPIDQIKMDRSFITDIRSHPHHQKIVRGIVSLAEGLGIDVIAEGIETPSDLSFLKTLNCALGQGFLFDRALPAAKVSQFLKTKWSRGYVSDSFRPLELQDGPSTMNFTVVRQKEN